MLENRVTVSISSRGKERGRVYLQQKTKGGRKAVVIIRLSDAQAQTNRVNNVSICNKYGCTSQGKLDVE